MIKYKYNGVLLPEFPDTTGYILSCIINLSGMYLLILANPAGGFVHGSDGSISLAASSTGKMYRALEYEWELYDTDDSTSVDGFYLMRPGTVEPIWTNINIPTSTGDVYLTASTAVPVQCCHHPSFIAGLAAGLASVGTLSMPGGNGEPIAYLYNGVQLPGLPETELPYSVIVWRYASDTEEQGDKEYLLMFQDSTHRVDEQGMFLAYYESGEFYRSSNKEWENTSIENYESLNIVWANYNVEKTDGSIYLLSNNPIPIYE